VKNIVPLFWGKKRRQKGKKAWRGGLSALIMRTEYHKPISLKKNNEWKEREKGPGGPSIGEEGDRNKEVQGP